MSDAQRHVHLIAAAVISGLMVVTWLVSLVKKDVSIVDICWGLGFALVAWTLYWDAGSSDASQLLIPAVVSAWAIRLSGHLAIRNLGKPEDFRYQAMRERWGNLFPLLSLLTVFGLQGGVMWVVSLPLQMAAISEASENFGFLAVGILLWSVGLFFESVGDWQLHQFRKNEENAGLVLDSGLWKFTRHPNYFGDSLVWWGLFCVCMAFGSDWWTIVSPLLMTFLLLRVSGVSLLEKTLRDTKSGYTEYVSRTNAFFPGFPKR